MLTSILPVLGMFKSVFAVRWRKIDGQYNYGTMFATVYQGCTICFTAKHVMPVLTNDSEIEIIRDGKWHRLGVKRVMDVDQERYDVIGFELGDSRLIGEVGSFELSEGPEGHVPGSPAMFMGFPGSWLEAEADYYEFYRHDMKFKEGCPPPVVKQSYLSYNHTKDGITSFYIGGTANKGFSGGPLFAYRNESSDSDTNFRTVICGVIVSHKIDLSRVLQNGQEEEELQGTTYADMSVAQSVGPLLRASR